MSDVKEKKNPKVLVNGTDVTGHVTTVVYGDVVEPQDIVLGCEHGRLVGQPCPHCMCIGAASPSINARGHAEAVTAKETAECLDALGGDRLINPKGLGNEK